MNPTMTAVLCVAAGGAMGAVLRYAAVRIFDGSPFPWATFAVNIAGCFLATFITARYAGMPQEARLFLIVGFMGALTTMSTFTTESTEMLFDGRYGAFAANLFLNVGVCLLAAIAGRESALVL